MAEITRRVFYSFHYKPDVFRVSQVRSIGKIEDNKPASDNDWETVKKGGDKAIKDWIAKQMNGRTCTVVLIGAETAGRKWVRYEIEKSWEEGMGVVGINIHGLKNSDGKIAKKGANPFKGFTLDDKDFSKIVKCYDPAGSNSKERYAWIKEHLSNAIEEAIKIRKKYK